MADAAPWAEALAAKQARTACRYYTKGRCTRGVACPFSHAAATVSGGSTEKVKQAPPKVTTEGDADVVSVLREALLKQWRGDGSHHTHMHGFHPRKATMHPKAVQLLLTLLPGTGPVLDPFVGTGTSAIQVMLQGRQAVGTDVSPLAIGIAKACCWLPTEEQLEELRQAERRITRSLEQAEKDANTEPGVVFATGCRGARAREIVRHTIDDSSPEVSLALWFVLDFEERTRHWDWQIDNPNVIEIRSASRRFRSTVRRFVEKLVDFRAAVPANTPMAKLMVADAREQVESFGLLEGVLTSPPYPGVFDYVEENEVGEEAGEEKVSTNTGLSDFVERMEGGIDYELEIGSKRLAARVDADAFRTKWQEDTVAWLTACTARLKIGGRIAMLIGNQTNGINALESVKEAVPLCGGEGYTLRVIAAASVREEDRVSRPWGGKWRPYRSEHTILLEKVMEV